jgi:hypothetical protein
MKFMVKRSVFLVCLLLVAYYVIMEFYYVNFVGLHYYRFGFYFHLSEYKYIESKFIFLFAVSLSVFVSRYSQFIYAIFIFFVVFFLVPSLVTYAFINQISTPSYAIFLLLIVLALCSLIRININAVSNVRISYGLTMFLIVLSLLPFLYTFGFYFNIKNIVLEDIFKTRDYFDENTSTIINYLYNWLVKAIIPILLIYFLIHKRHFFAIVCLLVLMYLYLISGNKIVYITSFIMLFFYFAGKDAVEKVKYFMLALLIGLLIIPVVDTYVIGGHSLKGTFVMRMLFLPAQLNYLYFDFFQGRPLFFAESNFFKMFVDYPYDKPIGFVISETYFRSSDMNANNGIISDGFMNLGYAGILLNIFIMGVVFTFFNSIKIDSRYLGVFCVMIFLFLSAPMLSMFVTSGLWIIFLMGLFVMREKTFSE